MKFELDADQVDKLLAWQEVQHDKAQTRDAIGARFRYVFVPTTLGMCAKVVDNHTGDELDLTDTENW